MLPRGQIVHINRRYFIKIFKRKNNEENVVEGELQEQPFESTSVWSHLTDEEVAKIRDKSRLPRDVWCELNGVPEHGTKFRHLEMYKRDYVRSYWAKYGEASGLKPGVCWPSVEELQFRKEFEKALYPSFQEVLDASKKKREEEAKNLAEYRSNILKNLKKLPSAKKAFFDKYVEIQQKRDEEKKKRDRLIQDVREFLGYDVSPTDTRFEEAVAKMEEQAKLIKKSSKKQEKQAKVLSLLAAMAEEELKKAHAESKGPQEAQEKKATEAKENPSGKKTPNS